LGRIRRSAVARRVVVIGGVVVACVAGAALLAEIAVRRYVPPSPPGMFTEHDTLGFRLTPNFRGEDRSQHPAVPLVFNSWGLRDREYGTVQGYPRLLVLGDSFVFGHGVRLEDTFTKVLERSLRARPGMGGAEVVNAGVPRYGTFQEIALLEEIVDVVRPDAVILTVYANDVLDNLAYARRHPRADAFAVRWFKWLRVHSQLYLWMRRRHHAATARMDRLQAEAVKTHAVAPSGEVARGLELTESAILRLSEIVRARGLRFAVVLAPSAAQADATRWQAALEQSGLAGADYDPDEPNRRFAEFAEQYRIPLLDLLPALRTAAEECYFTLHWNARGHAVAGAAVAAFLVQAGAQPLMVSN
jgi:hypothetical protein